MLNISASEHFVNLDELTSKELQELGFAVSQELSYLQSSAKDEYEVATFKGQYYYRRIKKAEKKDAQCGCPYDMPAKIAFYPKKHGESARCWTPKEEIYDEFFEYEPTVEIAHRKLRYVLQRMRARQMVVVFQSPKGSKIFPGRAKGTTEYNEEMLHRILDTTAAFQREYRHTYFVTLTMDASKYPHSLKSIWQQFGDKTEKFCKGLCRKVDGAYTAILEAHYSGRPHAHILFHTNEEFTDSKKRYSRSSKHTYIFAGRLRKIVDSCWNEGIADLQDVEAKKVKWYLAKYVAKNTKQTVDELLKKKEWTKQDYKQVMTMVFPMLFCVRQFRFSRLPKEAQESVKKSRPVMSCATKENASLDVRPPHFNAAEFSIDRLRSYLTRICTKSPPKCHCNVYVTTYYDAKRCLQDPESDLMDASEEEMFKIRSYGRCVSCAGCWYSQWLKQILPAEDEKERVEEVSKELRHLWTMMQIESYKKDHLRR